MLVFDTSVLCVWLRVPGKDTCGSGENRLTYEIVNSNNSSLKFGIITPRPRRHNIRVL